MRAALRSSERARCNTGVADDAVADLRGGGVGVHEVVPDAAAWGSDHVPELKSPPRLAAANVVGFRKLPSRPSEDEDLVAAEAWARDEESDRVFRSHCTATSRCQGNLGSPCWLLMSRALQ